MATCLENGHPTITVSSFEPNTKTKKEDATGAYLLYEWTSEGMNPAASSKPQRHHLPHREDGDRKEQRQLSTSLREISSMLWYSYGGEQEVKDGKN